MIGNDNSARGDAGSAAGRCERLGFLPIVSRAGGGYRGRRSDPISLAKGNADRGMFTVELTRGQGHPVVVRAIPLNVPTIARAIEGARALLDQAEAAGEGVDDYRIRDENGHSVASNWVGYPHA